MKRKHPRNIAGQGMLNCTSRFFQACRQYFFRKSSSCMKSLEELGDNKICTSVNLHNIIHRKNAHLQLV